MPNSIKSRLREYLEKLSFEITANDTIRCPFHDDVNPSMKIYDSNAFCFVCNSSFDIYDFAAWKLGLPCDKAHFLKIAREVESALGIASEWRPSTEERRAYYRRNRDTAGKQMAPLSESAVYREALLREFAEALDYGNFERASNRAELLFALFLMPETEKITKAGPR